MYSRENSAVSWALSRLLGKYTSQKADPYHLHPQGIPRTHSSEAQAWQAARKTKQRRHLECTFSPYTVLAAKQYAIRRSSTNLHMILHHQRPRPDSRFRIETNCINPQIAHDSKTQPNEPLSSNHKNATDKIPEQRPLASKPRTKINHARGRGYRYAETSWHTADSRSSRPTACASFESSDTSLAGTDRVDTGQL